MLYLGYLDRCVDCRDRKLRRFFSINEWDGLKYSNITEIYMSGNSLGILTEIPELPIKVLNVSGSKIEEVEDGCFKNILDLESLDLSWNNILKLHRKALWGSVQDYKIRAFVKMKYLSLAHNGLHTLPKEAFAFMPRLLSLDLSWNPLRVLDQLVMGSLSDLAYLKELNLSGCELETLPEGLFGRLHVLQRLDISYNRLKVVPAVLAEAVNLVYLNFDGNPITALEKGSSLSSLKNLQELSLCCHPLLKSIGEGALGYLRSLTVLRICNNPRLREVDDDFLTWYDNMDVAMLPVLKELDLHNNNLTEIDSHLLFRWDQLQKMDFSDNPYVCDCSNQWMVDVLVMYVQGRNGSAGDMICDKPNELRGMSFGQLRLEARTLPCQAQNMTAMSGPHTAIVLGVLIGVFVTFPLVLVLVLLWRKGYSQDAGER